MTRGWTALIFLLSTATAIRAQAPVRSATVKGEAPLVSSGAPSHTAANHSRDSLVVEQYLTKVRFENDGTGERSLIVRIHIQDAAGALQLRTLVFPYDDKNERMELRYLRVHKANGATVSAGANAVKEETPPVVRDAPLYASYKEEHISVPPLAAGDTLEYEITTRIMKPFAPGEFWFQHNFLSGEPARDEELEISVPQGRSVTVKSPAFPFEKQTANDRTIYTWHRSDSPGAPAKTASKRTEAPGEARPPDVALTTFTSWRDVARWYATLEQRRAEPNPEIRAKVEELIAGHTGSLQKIQAIYDYVCKNVRYVAIPFGEDGYEPHTAAEVFANGYGDAKDEQTLLAAMLRAAGLNADAVLIPYEHDLDVAVPSPSQFDHVVAAVSVGDALIWMDPTVELAPLRFLPAALRGKTALLVPPSGAGKVVQTPLDPPFPSVQQVAIDGHVSELGKLTATIHYSLRGDTELTLRLAFQKTPRTQWKKLGQTILDFDGLSGEVTSVRPTNLLDTQQPFEFNIGYAQSNFFDWSIKSQNVAMPLLTIGLPNAPKNSGQPIHIGSPLTVAVRLKLDLPRNFTVLPPVGVGVTRDYAVYKSTYQFARHVLTGERSITFKMRELSPTRADDYAAFTHAVTADENQTLQVDDTAPGPPAVPESAGVDQLLEAGLAALGTGNTHSAIPLFRRIVELDPRHKQAWNDLGLAYLRAGKSQEAATAFRKELAVNPTDEKANDYFGVALEQQQKYDEAAAAFRAQIKRNALDPVAHAGLAGILLKQRRYAEAIPELEKAAVLSPEDAELQIGLGRAYVNTGENEKAKAAFDHAARLSPTPVVWNELAYLMAEHNLDLDKARHYAQAAISATSMDLNGLNLSSVSPEQWLDVANLGAYWDSLGWIYFRKGEIDLAERYIRSAWLLDLDGVIGDHLAQIYEKLGQKDRAIHACALALAAPNPIPDTRARLTLLLGGNVQIDELVSQARPEIEKIGTIPAGKFSSQDDARAGFLILLSPGDKMPRVDGVRFASGSEELRPMASRLRNLDYGDVFPDASPVKLVRRATLSCSASAGRCTLSMDPAEAAVNSH